MAIATKTFHSPYITHILAADVSSSNVIVEGVIDLVKVTGTDGAHSTEATRSKATFIVTGSGVVAETIEVLAGDVLEGPFTKVECSAIQIGGVGADCDVFIYERDKVITA